MVARFEVYFVELNPTRGSEIHKTRPYVVISPDEANAILDTVIIVPMTSGAYPYPTSISINFKNKKGRIILDQLRVVDKQRLLKKLGSLDDKSSVALCKKFQEMFAY